MSDLISRKSLLNKINAYVVGSQDKEFICKLIKEMPSAENRGENKSKGHWICYPNNYPYIWKCDKCESLFKIDFNFCPRCGADMRGKAE